LSVVEVWADPRRILPNTASESSFGFAKQLLDTPRSVSFISEEAIDLFGLSAVEDLVRMVPGVFTTTRYGIQGAVDVRAVPADMFFRGMRRLSLQGHGRSVLAAMDTIEIAGGPPSPIYGMGKIGGYANVVPKSGRAQSGSYLTEVEGFVQVIGGNYRRREVSAGAGGPLPLLADKHGGYYVYGLDEDSDSYTEFVPVKQRLLQAAISIDDFAGSFRLEAGANYQLSRTAGALTGRFTQDLVDKGRYIRGTPLVDLDANGNGRAGYLEMHQQSPAFGPLNDGNQPLMQYWDWPTDANGAPLAIDQFPVVPGIPSAMYDYLVAHPEADPTGALRAQGVGGPMPQSGFVPIGLVLDPRTVGHDTLDLHRAAAYEKELRAEFLTLFLDFVYDSDPDLTIKNQLFFDRMDQFKLSNQPYAQRQDVHVIEDKLTVTRRLTKLPEWLRVNTLASLNVRNTLSKGDNISGGDFATHRTDAMAPTWPDAVPGFSPNANLISPIENSDLANDGYPWGTIYRSEFSEFGLGLMFDIDVDSRWNFLLGARVDVSHAENVNYASSFNPVAGTSANPGAYSGVDVGTSAWDDALSWSASASYALTRHIRPYATISRSAIVLDGNNNALSNEVIDAGHIGSASLVEVGIKGSLIDDKLFATLSAYEQARTNVDVDDPDALLYAYPTATKARGWSAELKWVPTRNLFVSAYAMHQVTRYDPNYSSSQLVDARTLGFQDVLDAQGNVIYPAEAFLYGGRSRVVLPANMPQYAKKQGNPETQLGFAATFGWNNGLGLSLSGNYFSETCTGRLCTVKLPDGVIANAGAFFNAGSWSVKLDVNNLLDKTYFRARTGDTLGNPLAQVLPDRRWQITLKAEF
jgi:outer membrane receptor protein involved in Fe transport